MSTAPGSYPGLLRSCSPVVYPGGRRGIVSDLPRPGWVDVLIPGDGTHEQEIADVALDVTNPTGAWHLATWIIGAGASDARWRTLTPSEAELLRQIRWGEALTDEDRAELCAIARELATVLGWRA